MDLYPGHANKKTRKRFDRKNRMMQKEDEECLQWHKSAEKKFEAPVPRFLLVEDVGRRCFSKEDVMKRTFWLGKALNLKSRDQLPIMKRVTIQRKQYIALTVDSPTCAEELLK